MKGHFSEAEARKLTGLSRQTLMEYRLGREDGKYSWPPKVTEGLHWFRVGKRGIVWLRAGLLLVQSWHPEKAIAIDDADGE